MAQTPKRHRKASFHILRTGTPSGSVDTDRRRPGQRGNLESTTWPTGYAPACPTCQQPTTGLRETRATAHGQVVIVAVAEPCGHPVDEHAAALQAGRAALIPLRP
jgi:hypothetical protein